MAFSCDFEGTLILFDIMGVFTIKGVYYEEILLRLKDSKAKLRLEVLFKKYHHQIKSGNTFLD
jgi:hypothetical protein